MNLRQRDRVVLALLGVFALLGAYYLLALKPEQQQASSLQSQIAAQRQALATAQQDYNMGRAAQASLKKDGREWAALKLAVPPQADVPALLRTLERNANAVHVGMQAISLSGSGSSAPAGAAPPAGTTATAATATPVPVQLTFNGGYDALNTLVRKLTGLVEVSGGHVRATGPLLSINNVSLSGTKDLTGNLTATIYQLATPAGTTTTGGQG